jgi:hypothetical protein
MALVGCTEENAPLIEETCRRTMAILEAHVPNRWFFFGSRPSRAEFAWYGQLTQLIVDPTPSDIMRATAPYTARWIMQVDDLGGVDGAWTPGANEAVVEGLLQQAGEVYFPFLIANAEAADHGEETFSFSALGMRYEQGTFRYQLKCLSALRAAFARLSPAARERLDPLLSRTGCLEPLS